MARKGLNIYKRKDNRWEGRFLLKQDSKPRFIYFYGKTYREVKGKMMNFKMPEGLSEETDRKVVAHFSEEWLRLKRQKLKPLSYIKYQSVIEKYVCPYFGKKIPSEITAIDIEGFGFELMTTKRLSKKSVKDILIIFHGILKYAQKETDALRTVDFVYPTIHPSEQRILSEEETVILIKTLLKEGSSLSIGIYLAFMTGMRIGEICALKWKNISLCEGTVSVQGTMQRVRLNQAQNKTQVICVSPKSRASQRVIPMDNYTRKIISDRKSDDGEAYVLTGCKERFVEPRMLQYYFQKILKKCNLYGVHFHTLRHTFATKSIETGFDVKSLSEILGHSNIETTLNLYVHSSIELKRKNMNQLAHEIFENQPSEKAVNKEENAENEAEKE